MEAEDPTVANPVRLRMGPWWLHRWWPRRMVQMSTLKGAPAEADGADPDGGVRGQPGRDGHRHRLPAAALCPAGHPLCGRAPLGGQPRQAAARIRQFPLQPHQSLDHQEAHQGTITHDENHDDTQLQAYAQAENAVDISLPLPALWEAKENDHGHRADVLQAAPRLHSFLSHALWLLREGSTDPDARGEGVSAWTLSHMVAYFPFHSSLVHHEYITC